MRNDRNVMSLLLTTLLVSLLFTSITSTIISHETTLQGLEQSETKISLLQPEKTNIVAGTPHGPIAIDGNEEFKIIAEAESWEGEGSESSPYIIEGFDFDLGGSAGTCIEITDTTSHFIIRDCSMQGADPGYGIYFLNVTNCEISTNTLFLNQIGMRIDADNISIVNNDVDATSWSKGIHVSGMGNSLLSGNTIIGGVIGLHVEGADPFVISNNTVTDSTFASMYLGYSDNVTVSDNDFIGGDNYGMYIELSDNCIITGNTISLSSEGIFFTYSSNNLIKECTIEENTNGVTFDIMGTSFYNSIEFCEIRNNTERGIVNDASAYATTVKWNVFLNNPAGPIESDDSSSIFDYNYYDVYSGLDVDNDKVGDTPFTIPGSAGNQDPHPLILYPTYTQWDSSPADQSVEFGDEFSYSLAVTGPVPIANWDISDVTNFEVDDTGTIENIDRLEVGTYPIDILATNSHGLSLEGSFILTVGDSVSPVWISQIQDKSYSFGEDIEIQVVAWDLAGIDSWEISDSSNFSITSMSSYETSVVTITGIVNLLAGEYSITLTAYDPSENYIATTFVVIVSSETGTHGQFGFEFVFSTGGLVISIVALIFGIGAFLNTRKKS